MVLSSIASVVSLPADDTLDALLFQLPPRTPRDEPATPLRSFQSQTLPDMSKAP